MKILVTGSNGQVGWELERSLMPLGEVLAVDLPQFDLSKPETVVEIVRAFKPEVIVNPAAYTAVDKAESEIDLAMQINGNAPGILAEEAKKLGALLIHYSTDYVFDGAKAVPYLEDDQTNPLSVYGRSKLAGEEAIRAGECDHVIFRTSWVFSSRAQNFMRSILRLAREREELKIVADQIGAPTWARNIADATAQVIGNIQVARQKEGYVSGVYNLTSSGSTSWYGFSQEIIAQARQLYPAAAWKVQRVMPIPTEDYPLPAPRPKNSRMNGDKLFHDFGLIMPPWQKALACCMRELNYE